MKKWTLLLLLLFAAGVFRAHPQDHATFTTEPAPSATTEPTLTTAVPTAEPPVTTTLPPVVLDLTTEEQEMLLKIGMAELGTTGCQECVALVMRTILNRVEADGFSASIQGVLFAQDQFTPVWDGTYEAAEPNDVCYEALDMVMRGWDESQGALYYEFCDGPSWHSQNLTLLFQHCNTRFYQ